MFGFEFSVWRHILSVKISYQILIVHQKYRTWNSSYPAYVYKEYAWRYINSVVKDFCKVLNNYNCMTIHSTKVVNIN